ncbi:MAG: DUF5695 domain-containing protein [Oscillospiraceae bacterium]|jgi:hypothetical protein|nr:DUF5695 domain-containing protein [Oscillospiraceae bacterium]
MQKTQKTYQLSGTHFNTLIKGCALLSVEPGAAQSGLRDTQFVLPGQSFGGIELAWKQNGKTNKASLGLDSDTNTNPPQYTNRGGHCSMSCNTGSLEATVTWELDGCSLLQKVQLKNTSDEALKLMDVGYKFYGNTEFKFGTSAADKVLGHHFISDHGSRLLFVRCDGQAPYLLILPENETKLEYFELKQEKDKPSAYIAYALSAKAVKKAKNSRMPTPGSSLTLEPGENVTHTFRWLWARDNDDVRCLLVEHGIIDIDVAPGLTVPAGSLVTLSAHSRWDDIKPEFPDGTEEIAIKQDIYRFRLTKLGENKLVFNYNKGKRRMTVTFFVTESIETLIKKRGAFIASKQHTDPSLWYNGLLAEWNNETGVLLGPDNYDKIGGWRIYEVSCDDPGLSKPAFLSGKLAEYPVADEIKALDLYVERFVWGGLQCTEDEPYPYGIYGIPDWKKNRDSEDDGPRGKMHIWRIYDYPHIFLMYYNMYRIARDYPDMPLTHDAKTYLCRAHDTAIALFSIPMDIIRWDARNTGLYNELCIEEIIEALRVENLPYDRLERHWQRKCHYFAVECTDLYSSEYPFDTTGFESTHALAKRALRKADDEILEHPREPQLTREKAVRFMETQIACNIATRGVLEPAYYWYGSDYRTHNTAYTLSYMSQMGGWAIVDYALYYARDPFFLLRLGYGSLLSSWALMNTGYWFEGDEHDGAACGGFEPSAHGMTWLDQEHKGGPWYYSCEIDLGFCGALRGAATIVAKDPKFGLICYGGSIIDNRVHCEDGIFKRFSIVTATERLHIRIDKGRFEGAFIIDEKQITFKVDPCGTVGNINLQIESEDLGEIIFEVTNTPVPPASSAPSITLPCKNGTQEIKINWQNSIVLLGNH